MSRLLEIGQFLILSCQLIYQTGDQRYVLLAFRSEETDLLFASL